MHRIFNSVTFYVEFEMFNEHIQQTVRFKAAHKYILRHLCTLHTLIQTTRIYVKLRKYIVALFVFDNFFFNTKKQTLKLTKKIKK